MASVKLKFIPLKPVSDNGCQAFGKEGQLVVQVTHNGRSRNVPTGFKILDSEWDKRNHVFILPADSERLRLVCLCRVEVRRDMERLRRIMARLDLRQEPYSVDEVVDSFSRFKIDYSISAYMTDIIADLRLRGHLRTSEIYQSTLRSFLRFTEGKDVCIDMLTPELLSGYEYYMRCRGLTPNTTSFYMRVLRAVYNRAVDAGAVDPVNPFRHVYTGIDKTRKRALRIDDIRRIMRLDLGSLPSLDYARDIFMLSFYMRGMSLIDMAYLRKSDLCDGYVVYRRRKTRQKLYVAWTQELQYMVDKYSDDNSPYLFPIFRRKVSNPYSSYRNVSYRINYSLRKIAKMINYDSPLTLYCARHSWASIAQAKNIPLSVISAGMGHNSEMTTRIYLASLDNTLIDRANSIILKAIR